VEITIHIPALDKLADALFALANRQAPTVTPQSIPTPMPTVAAPMPTVQHAPAPTIAAHAPTVQPTPAPVPTATTAPSVTLDAVQRAAVGLSDLGKRGEVTAMFPEFGIQKLSDLKGDQLAAFAARLTALGARIA
jgi:hypothetical protein